MSLTILSVAFPFAPVSRNASGGAEQILSLLDAALVGAGHQSIVIACEGSATKGILLPIPACLGEINDQTRGRVWPVVRSTIDRALEQYDIALVHMHGLDFHAYLPTRDVPVLVTLHLPPDWYPAAIFHSGNRALFMNCVSQTQASHCPAAEGILPPIANGIDFDSLQIRLQKRNFTLVLGRVCQEKGFHLAIDAAAKANVPLLLAGERFAYEAHARYFRTQIEPRLNPSCRFIGPLALPAKRRLLTQARCLLVPSLAAETSSLVTMEAMACGTPVIAFPAGALPELIDHGRTGFIVNGVEEMAEALHHVHELDTALCREIARRRFSAHRMTGEYIQRYSEMAATRRTRSTPDSGVVYSQP